MQPGSLKDYHEAPAWRIATQFARRAPARLTLLEGDFEFGFYHLLLVVRRDAPGPEEASGNPLIDVNRDGTAVRLGFDWPHHEERFRDLTLLFAPAHSVYEDLAEQAGLLVRKPLPPLTRESLSFRFVASWLQMHLALGYFYRCWHGVDPWGRVRSGYFAAFPQPELSTLAETAEISLQRWHPAHRYWFIVEEPQPEQKQRPVACVGSDGLLRMPDGSTYDLRHLGAWDAVAVVRAQAGLPDWPAPLQDE
jgi:hypothetical protein